MRVSFPLFALVAFVAGGSAKLVQDAHFMAPAHTLMQLTLSPSLGPAGAMPAVGFGTCNIATFKCLSPHSAEDGQPLVDALSTYLEAGGRLVDTAELYANQPDVGRALAAMKQKGVALDGLFLSTKISVFDMIAKDPTQSVDKARKEMQLDALHLPLSLVMLHAPIDPLEASVEAWRALIRAQKEGKVVHIGVSNFNQEHIERLAKDTGVWPQVNQMLFNPATAFADEGKAGNLAKWCKSKGIVVSAYNSLSASVHQDADGDALVTAANTLANERKGTTAAQMLLRWALDQGVAVNPGARSQAHIIQNLQVQQVAPLTPTEMQAINTAAAQTTPPPLMSQYPVALASVRSGALCLSQGKTLMQCAR